MRSAFHKFATIFVRNITKVVVGVVAVVSLVLVMAAVVLAPIFIGIYVKYGEVSAVYQMKVLGDTWGPVVGVINVTWMIVLAAAGHALITVLEEADAQ